MTKKTSLTATAGYSRKFILSALASTALISTSAYAGPEGGQISAGSGQIINNGSNTTINQDTQNLSINWQSFDIDAGEAVRFNQPGTSSIALNRILGQNASKIMGELSANGQVFVLNPNGVLFGKGAQVNVGGMTASTHELSDEDFMAGNYSFSNAGDGRIVNKGSITARDGSYVALLAKDVRNEGKINVKLGKVVMAAGDEVTLDIDNGSLVSYSVDKGTMNGLVENRQLVKADGGEVYMTAKAADDIGKAVVNNTGVVEARTVQKQNGAIILGGEGAGSEVNVAGTLDASAPDQGTGGKIVASADHVAVKDNAGIDASGTHGGGEVYVGGGWQGKDKTIANAETTVVSESAEIDVTAEENGDGGTAVLWADGYTGFHGTIKARGGAQGGNGGQVETSGKAVLHANGDVDAGATMGAKGKWLLDPFDVEIVESGAAGTAFNSGNYDPAATSQILAENVVNALEGSDVTITTGNGGSDSGDITVSAEITKTDTTNTTLTLEAANSIFINDKIESTYTNSGSRFGRLNVVLTANSDNSGGGDITFNNTGRIITNNGNFIAGAGDVGRSNSVLTSGNNLTMEQGSFIDVDNGVLAVNVNNDINLHEESLRSAGSSRFYSNIDSYQYLTNYIRLNSENGEILSQNTDSTTADILTSSNVTLDAGNIGRAANPVKISAPSSTTSRLNIYNAAGSSYVNEIGNRTFATIDIDLGAQANSTHQLDLRGDPSGGGHILLNTDSSGVLNLADDDIDTSATSTSVAIQNPDITFANGSVDTGMAGFTASATNMITNGSINDDVAEINARSLSLNGSTIGEFEKAIEISGGSNLNVNNTGGSTYLESVDDSYSSISLIHVEGTGFHSILFSGGDHLNYDTDGSRVYVPTISASGCGDGSGFACGMDVSRENRDVRLSANSGDMVFADNAVNTNAGSFTASITGSNREGSILAENDYDASNTAAQITAGNVTFYVYNSSTPGTIGGGNKHIQIARGEDSTGEKTLHVDTHQGNVNIHELTEDHFKTLYVELNGSNASQDIAIDLAGPDDVNFSDNGNRVVIDGEKVNLSSYDRNWTLSTPVRDIQVDGTSVSRGNYTLDTRQNIYLNGDITTNGGSIRLGANNGVYLMQDVFIDSNSDNVSRSGTITVEDVISSVSNGLALDISSASTDDRGTTITLQDAINNDAGHYLAGVNLDASSAENLFDGRINLQDGEYYVDGDFISTGNTTFSRDTTIDTEQGNDDHAGDIIFNGTSLSGARSRSFTFDASTTASGMDGGNVDLYTERGSFSASDITVNATGDSDGSDGAIDLQRMFTTDSRSNDNDQYYEGDVITLYGDLRTDRGNVTLTSNETRIAGDVTIDTLSYTNSQSSAAGDVTISSAEISPTAAGYSFAIDTSASTGTWQYNGSSNYDYDAGKINIGAIDTSDHYLQSLRLDASAGGTYNNGTANDVTLLKQVSTTGDQIYGGATVSLAGDLTTDGGNIDFSRAENVSLNGDRVFDTDREGGSRDAGALRLGDVTFNEAVALTIDTTADGGGASGDLAMNGTGNTTPLTTIDVRAGNLTLTDKVEAAGDITMEARGEDADLTLDSTVTSAGGLITLAAQGDFTNNNTEDTGINAGKGRYLVYSTAPADTLEAMTGYNKHYNQEYVRGQVPSYPDSGDWFLYSIAPELTITPEGNYVLEFDEALGEVTSTYSGFIDGDTEEQLNGMPNFTTARSPGVQNLVYSGGVTNDLGYVIVKDATSTGEVTILPAPNPTPATTQIGSRSDGETLLPKYTSALNTANSYSSGIAATKGVSSRGATLNTGNDYNMTVSYQDEGVIDIGGPEDVSAQSAENGPDDATSISVATDVGSTEYQFSRQVTVKNGGINMEGDVQPASANAITYDNGE